MRADLAAQVALLLAQPGGARPPLHLWNPPLSGDIDIRIAVDGSWYHEGSRFEREALVRLFATILKREGDEHFLVTPVEKWRIRVDNTPFVAVDAEVLGAGAEQQLVFITNVGERVHCDAAHPLRMQAVGTDRQPRIEVRDGLEARLSRSLFYRLVECGALTEQGGIAGAWSGGHFFALEAH